VLVVTHDFNKKKKKKKRKKKKKEKEKKKEGKTAQMMGEQIFSGQARAGPRLSKNVK